MIIGITTTLNKQDGFERVNLEYIERVASAGATPILLPPVPGGRAANEAAARAALSSIDALVLSGGGDIDPELFGQERLPETTLISRRRDEFELALARLAHENDLPTLGVCRGMQVMNVALGGTLYQDVKACGLTEATHQQEPPYEATTQQVSVASGSLLAALLCNPSNETDEEGFFLDEESSADKTRPKRARLKQLPSARGMIAGCQAGWPAALETGNDLGSGKEACSLQANSMHHQAVARIAAPLLVSAVSPDGVIEGLEDPHHRFFLGIQWHPEYLDSHNALFEALVCATFAR